MLQTSGLSYSYSNGETLSFPDISVEKGQNLLILGNSGCGKTTLLHLLAGLRAPTSGDITLDDQVINRLSPSAMDSFRGTNIGMIFQVPHFVRSLTVIENLNIAQSLAGLKIDSQRAQDLLGRLNLAVKANKKTQNLSVGEQQRVAIIRALINHPKIIFADEPTSALDDANTEQVIEMLKTEAKMQDATLVVVTHDQRLKDNFENKIML